MGGRKSERSREPRKPDAPMESPRDTALDLPLCEVDPGGMNKTLFLFVTLLAVGCSSEDETSGAGGSGGTASDAAPDTTPEASPNDGSADTASDGLPPDVQPDTMPDVQAVDSPAEVASDAELETGPDAPADVKPDIGPVSSCDELNAISCFANAECDGAERCENAGTELDPVSCCVPGPRGTGQAGSLCDSENDCESGVCISGSGDGMCSKTCETEADCPDGMKDCTYIAFSGSDDDWCFPTGD